MTTYTQTQARQNLDALLDHAATHGEARIRLDDGREFVLRPVAPTPRAAPPADRLCPTRQRDLSGIAGTWVDDPGFEEALIDQRRIDPEMWK